MFRVRGEMCSCACIYKYCGAASLSHCVHLCGAWGGSETLVVAVLRIVLMMVDGEDDRHGE